MPQLRLERSYIERRWLKHFCSPHSGLARQVSPSSSSDLAEQLQRRLRGETLDETLDDLPLQIDGEKRLLQQTLQRFTAQEAAMQVSLSGNTLRHSHPGANRRIFSSLSSRSAARKGAQAWAWPCARKSCSRMAARSACTHAPGTARSALSPYRGDWFMPGG